MRRNIKNRRIRTRRIFFRHRGRTLTREGGLKKIDVKVLCDPIVRETTMPLYIIEGNIGAGKSTLLENLSTAVFDFEHVVVQEPVDVWQGFKDISGTSIFEKYYGDMNKYGFVFQTLILTTRVECILDAVKSHPDKVVFCERSFLTDKHIFAKGMYDDNKLDEMSWRVFDHIYDFVTKEIHIHIDGMIYLRCDPDVCMRRIGARARAGELAIAPGYIEKLHRAHEAWMGEAGGPLLTIDGNGDLSDTDHWRDEMRRIAQFVTQPRDCCQCA